MTVIRATPRIPTYRSLMVFAGSLFLAVVMSTGFSYYYVTHENRHWCAALNLIVVQNKKHPPPNTAANRAFARDIDNVRRGFGCSLP